MILKNLKKLLKHVGTKLRVLSEGYSMNTTMTGFRFKKNICILMLSMQLDCIGRVEGLSKSDVKLHSSIPVEDGFLEFGISSKAIFWLCV